MLPSSVFRSSWILWVCVLLLSPPSIQAQTEEAENTAELEMLKLRIQVFEKGTGDPVKSAEVFVRSEMEGIEFEKSVKTNSQGIVRLSDVPLGKILIQVTAKRWEPFGDWYDLNHADQASDGEKESTWLKENNEEEERIILIEMEKESVPDGEES